LTDSCHRLDALSEPEALAAFLRCCGSRRWAEAMRNGRPYRLESALLAAADSAFVRLERSDWLEAFSHHPRIGDRGSLAERFPHTAGWSRSEQGGVAGTGQDVLDALLEANREYETRFGHIFIVCATGKSAAEMLGLLRERLPNDADRELEIAAAEQRKITAIRLEKLLSEVTEVSALTTHVLDTSLGRPAAGVAVTLERREAGAFVEIGRGRTDTDGRCRELLPNGVSLQSAVYRLTFDAGAYFGERGTPSFYPQVSVVFEVHEPSQHHHVPLLLSPFGYSTYRGS
jgi:hydroxyisourate hydrolase